MLQILFSEWEPAFVEGILILFCCLQPLACDLWLVEGQMETVSEVDSEQTEFYRERRRSGAVMRERNGLRTAVIPLPHFQFS